MTFTNRDLGQQLPDPYGVEVFTDQGIVSEEDVVAMWLAEHALEEDEARRRVQELLLVATDRNRHVAGVYTTYLARHEQLRAELWHSRVFVAAAHRQSHLALALALKGRDRLAEQFVRGQDTRGIGVIFNVENSILKRALPQASWPRTDFAFIGENDRGDHVRVYYFPGARAPEPG